MLPQVYATLTWEAYAAPTTDFDAYAAWIWDPLRFEVDATDVWSTLAVAFLWSAFARATVYGGDARGEVMSAAANGSVFRPGSEQADGSSAAEKVDTFEGVECPVVKTAL